ncbi:MAG: leucine-rich repeat domain-containing protein [Ruminococcus sp.]|nr:leucine-rich repeat domain-containing protein [Ruminococcus sp.]
MANKDTETTTTVTTVSENTETEPPETTTTITATSENIETELTETTTEKKKVVIGGRDYDIDPKYLVLDSYDLTAEDADALSQLTYIRTLELGILRDDKIEDVSKALSGIKDYSGIYFQLRDAEVSDLSFLTELPNLKEVEINFCHIDDYSALGDIPTLETLSLLYSGTRDISQLESLTRYANLKSLRIYHSSINDISFIKGLPNLEDLDISYTDVEDISPISSLTNLKHLDIYNQISDISPIADLTGLEYLSFEYYNSDCINTLSKLTNLKRLVVYIRGNNDISSLGNLSDLEYLRISYGFDIEQDEIDALEKALSNCDIHYEYNEYLKYELEHK